jgi:hypothetical protein
VAEEEGAEGVKLYTWRRIEIFHGEEAFVVAASEDEAIAALRATVPNEPNCPRAKDNKGSNYENRLLWFEYDCKKRVVDEMLDHDGYDLIVLEPGHVAWAEKL